MKQTAVIVDVDGTIADNTHRQHFISYDPKDWTGFFGECKDDTPRNNVLYVVKYWKSQGDEIVFVTGRNESSRTDTRTWLKQKCGIYYGQLYMRPDDDRRHDHVVKREIYERDIAPHYDVRLVLEDRASVVKMWREIGLETWQVDEGNF